MMSRARAKIRTPAKRTVARVATPPTRNQELRRLLANRRNGIVGDVRSRLRDGRAERSLDVSDSIDESDAHVQVELDLALLQMRSETLVQIDEALRRLDAGKYGVCFECGAPITERRVGTPVFSS